MMIPFSCLDLAPWLRVLPFSQSSVRTILVGERNTRTKPPHLSLILSSFTSFPPCFFFFGTGSSSLSPMSFRMLSRGVSRNSGVHRVSMGCSNAAQPSFLTSQTFSRLSTFPSSSSSSSSSSSVFTQSASASAISSFGRSFCSSDAAQIADEQRLAALEEQLELVGQPASRKEFTGGLP